MKSIVITGATGYIGLRLLQRALEDGWTVHAASRRKLNWTVDWIPFDLSEPLREEDLAGIHSLVHLAANTKAASIPSEGFELIAARRLIETCRIQRVKFVFVSSQTARADAPTAYGRAKWRIEQEVLAAGGWVVRAGQVYGGAESGLFGILVGMVRALPVLPSFLPSPQVQPIHVDDLAEGLLRIVSRTDVPSGAYNLAAPEPVSFSAFLAAIAAGRVRRRRLFVPVPLPLLMPALALAARLLPRAIDAGRLRSLVELPRLSSAEDLRTLGLRLRPLVGGMHPAGDDRRRRLFVEGRALLTYLLRQLPLPSTLRRYVRAIETLRGGQALQLPGFFHSVPAALALVDGRRFLRTNGAAELDWRLDAATVIAEASPAGARRFLGLGERSGIGIALVWIGGAILAQAFWLLLRVSLAPVLRRALRGAGG